MSTGRLQRLWGKVVKVHLNFDTNESWIVTRFAKMHFDIHQVKLMEVRFVVNEEVRQVGLDRGRNIRRVLSGWAEGIVVNIDVPQSIEGLHQVNYHPYDRDTFFDVASGAPVVDAKEAYFHTDGKVYCLF